MKLKLNILTAAFLICAIMLNKSFAQSPGKNFVPSPIVYTIFDADSLKGFDEDAARRSAISENFLGAEFKVRMYKLKRQYINNKYNLWPKPQKVKTTQFSPVAKTQVVPACVNEDFESSTAGAITTSNQVLGWTVLRGLNDNLNPPSASFSNSLHTWYPNGIPSNPAPNSCNQLGCCLADPEECEIINVPAGGYIDPEIGPVYPIFSVFGTTPGPALAQSTNTHLSQPLFGNQIIRINSNLSNYSMINLSKTFSVTSSNALFQFAFISVFSTGHGCCDAGAFQIKLYNATTNQPITCPSFSASALSSQCTNTATGISYLVAGTGAPAGVNSGDIFNKWQIASMDLTQYISQNIKIEIVTSDCTAGGHFGYVYFDAQCGPMSIIGNNVPFPAGSGSVTVPTCGAAGATICATPGLGPYSWQGPNIPPSFTQPSYTNQCFVSNISATYTLSMNPPGSCVPITRIVNSSITPAPALTASVMQATCGGSIATVTVFPGGSATNPANVNWFPIPQTLNTTTTIATYVIPNGPASNIISITANDPVGCSITTTAEIQPAAPTPTFALNFSGPSFSITCANPTVYLNASSNYLYNGNALTYFWQGPSVTFSNTTDIEVSTPQTFTVNGLDPVTLCSTNSLITVGVNTIHPTSSLSHNNQQINCTTTPSMVTSTVLSPTVNVSQTIYDPLGGSVPFVGTSLTGYFPTAGPGVYSVVTSNDLNGCSIVKTLTITSSQGFPTANPLFSSPANFTLGCTTKSIITVNITGAQTTTIDINGNQQPLGGPVSYTILSPSASTVLPAFPALLHPSATTPTLSVPGTWTVVIRDNNNGCDTRIPISVISRTLGPAIDTLLVPENILTCKIPSITIRAVSNVKSTKYNWAYDVFGNIPTTTVGAVANFSAALTSSLAETFSLTLTDSVSTCTTKTVIPIAQNLYPPKARISGLSEITCAKPSIQLDNSSVHGLPANTQFIPGVPIGFKWMGPSPMLPAEFSTQYEAIVPGEYTLVAMDSRNGCTSQTVFPVANGRVYPQLSESSPTVTVLDCGASNTIQPIFTTSANLSYTWTTPADAPPTSNPNANRLVVSEVGTYNLFVLNNSTGCSARLDNNVIANNNMTTDFTPDKITGFAPLTVNFENNSRTSSGTASLSSVWNFGNSSSATFTNNSSTSATYKQPGTYTVTLFTKKGSCQNSVSKVITVDLPSTLSIPNVFTPNGDNVNDLYFLKTTNLSDIDITIYDRWGNKVYVVQSTKGNIAWDGKNQYGKESPEGTYFYVIKAIGKDGKEYNDKGTINLFR
jgi:gliding motility-associated-like protein